MVMAANHMRTDSDAANRAWRSPWAALILVALLAGCDKGIGSSAGRALEAQAVTDFTATTELFVEFAPLMAGERTTFAAHFTRLHDYKPVTEGTLDVVLSGGDAPTERFRIETLRAPGIFAPTVAPRAAGERRLQLVLTAPGLEVEHDLGAIVVHASREAAAQAPRSPSPQGEIGFLKEQQWQTDFAIEEVRRMPLRESVTAPATVRASSEGAFIVAAPAPGLVRARGTFPVLGGEIERGQILATLVPHLGVGADSASLQVALVSARNAAALARTEVERMERLFAQQAVSARRLDEARANHQVSLSQLQAAEQRMSQLGGDGQGGIELRAPIGGALAQVHVANGAAVDQGAPLFHIVDRRELWLEVQVAESDAARLQTPTGAAFELPGLAEPVEIRVGNGGRLVGVGQAIDARSRSVPVIFAMRDPDPRIVLNQVVQARIFTGAERDALSVPVTAVIDDGGKRVVYVMRGGESFSRIPVRLGDRDGDRIEVLEGLTAGDRIVSRGAIQVRLAAATPEAMGHGHAH